LKSAQTGFVQIRKTIFMFQIVSLQNHKDQTIKTVAEKGFKMIFSNYDALYLDCGFENYSGLGNNWCTPYKSNFSVN
jgi:hypothetical protein